MGTYTTNYNLFLPTIGEQGWGELVNGNFTTIDATMNGLDGRISTNTSNISSLTTRMNTAENNIITIQNNMQTFQTMDGYGSNYFSVLKLNTEVTFISSATGTVSSTHIYKANPLTNTITFTCHAGGASSGTSVYSARTYIQINGTIVLDTGNTSSTNRYILKEADITLNDGDVVYSYIYHAGGSTNGSPSYVKMSCTPYLISK